MLEKDKELLQRWGHGAAAVTVNSDCVEVILFGGYKEFSLIADTVVGERNKKSSPIADTVVVRFGECSTVPLFHF